MKQEHSISSFLVLERGFQVGFNWVSTNVETTPEWHATNMEKIKTFCWNVPSTYYLKYMKFSFTYDLEVHNTISFYFLLMWFLTK
jgi:hypothetical protein